MRTSAKQVHQLVQDYLSWIKDRTIIKEVGQWVEVTTPYVDQHNDFIQIYIKRNPDGYLFTDDGYILRELEQAGCQINTPKRRHILNFTLSSFGLREEDGQITSRANDENFTIRKHMFIQGLLSIQDMFFLASPTVVSLFLEDVARWLDVKEVRYTPKVKLTGHSGYDHVFDFVIPKSPERPERLLRALNRLDRDMAEAMAFAWVDTQEARPERSKAYAILNDTEKEAPPSVMEALESYEIVPVPWSRREEYTDQLAA